MTKVLAPDVFRQHFDNLGAVLNGGKIYTYEGGSTTPTTTWTSSTGSGVVGAQANPIVLDSAGREQGGIWITKGIAYKFILKDASGTTLDTVDNIVVGEVEATTSDEYEVCCTFAGTPGAQAFMAGHVFVRDVSFQIDFAGSAADVVTPPSSDYEVIFRLNGVDIGGVTFDSNGDPTFETSGGTTVDCVGGDVLRFYGDDISGTGADYSITLLGSIV